MASGSSSSSMFFIDTTRVDHMEPMMNSHQDSNHILPTSLVPTQQLHHHVVAPMEQISNQPGPSYPDAEVVLALSPTTLLDTSRYVCDVCFKGFPRVQNLKFHQRVHNLPFNPQTRIKKDFEPRKVYLCPEPTCNHHHRSNALGDFGALRKHYLRKHSNEKKYGCDSCSKRYAIENDLKAHLKICGAKKYNCNCGARFSRSSQFAYHLGVCDARENEGATTHPPALDMGDITIRSTSNTNSSNLEGSTTSNLSAQISSIQNPFNSFSSIAPNQSQWSHFAAGHENFLTEPSMGLNVGEIGPAFFSSTSTQQNQFQENSDIWLYENPLTNNIPYNNSDLNNIRIMGNGGNYGSEEGLNSFSGGVGMLDHSSSLNSTSVVHNTTLRQELSAPQFIMNEDLLALTFRNNNTSNMVQGCTNSSSSGVGGFIVPQDHNVLGSERFGIADDIRYNTTFNQLLNPESGNTIGSSIFNQNVGSSYNLGDYYGFVDGSSYHYHQGGQEVFNFDTSAAAALAPSENQLNQHRF